MPELTLFLRCMWRASLTADSVLTLDETAEALPGQPADTKAWIARNVEPFGEVMGAQMFRWGDVVKAFANPVAPPEVAPTGPVTTWRDASRRLGVSHDTIAKRRAERDPERRCFFIDTEELQAWWRRLLAPRPLERSKPGRKAA